MAVVKIKFKIPDWLDRICVWPLLVYRKRKYGYPFRRIPLTDGKYAVVDPPDYYLLNSFDWFARSKQCGTFYACRFNSSGNGPAIEAMHRLIMGSPVGMLIDHRNCNGLDDRRENLRQATHSQNSCNKQKRKNTSSQYIGVSFRKKWGTWGAAIKHKKKSIWLGTFNNEIDAAKAYDKAAVELHGIFARLNFPESADCVGAGQV